MIAALGVGIAQADQELKRKQGMTRGRNTRSMP